MSEKAGKYQRQRQAAVQAAATVFASKGYHGASTTDIADALGIKQGSLYYYFRSKEEALLEVCLYGISDYARRMHEIASGDQSFDARIIATVMAHLSAYREKNEALKVFNDERLYLSPDNRTKLKELGSQYRQDLELVLNDAQQSGDISSDVDCHFAAQSLIGLCNSWGQWIIRDPELNLFEVASKCAALFLTGCKGT